MPHTKDDDYDDDEEAAALTRKSVDEPSSEEFARMSRSERKKYREKKRRSDVNKGFDELMALLIRVDPGLKAEIETQEKSKRHQNKSCHSTDADNHVLNRVHLISRTTMALGRMYRQNQEQKALIAELSREKRGDISNNNADEAAAAAAKQAIKDNRVSIPRAVLTTYIVWCASSPSHIYIGVLCAAYYYTGTHDDSLFDSIGPGE
jgi:hypothetical protein